MTDVNFVCPACHGALRDAPEERVCIGCGATYKRMPAAYADFAGPGVAYDEWWSSPPERANWWLATMAPKDERFQVAGAQRVVAPLLAELGLEPGRAAVLSAACGLAGDVEALNAAGYATWGIDCGSRSCYWSSRNCRDRLARADMFALPFADASFDMVMALNALEHIGVVGDSTEVQDDHERQRLDALRSLLRVTRPGGYVLLSGVARRFPVDLFHTPAQGQAPSAPGATWLDRRARLHSPFERFSLSFGDQARLARATGLVEWIRPLPLRGFFAYTNVNRSPLGRRIRPLLDWALGGLPPPVYGSWLSFFIIALVRRRGVSPEERACNFADISTSSSPIGGTSVSSRSWPP